MDRIAVGIAAAILIFGIGGCGSLENEETALMEETGMKISVKSSEYEIIYELNGSGAACDLLEQLPLTVETEPFSNNEITFYPPEELNTGNTPLGSGEAGTLAYYAPWGDVVMFYAPCSPNNSLFELGKAVSGEENVEGLTGTVTVSVFEE